MNLLEQEWSELRRLLSLVQEGRLSAQDEQKLRYIVWKNNRAAFKMDLGQLLHVGFVLVGMNYLQQEIQQLESGLAAG